MFGLKQKIYLFIFLGAVLITVFWGVVLYKLNGLKNENVLLYGEINEAEQNIEEAKNTEIAYDELKGKMDAINEIILNKDDFVKLIENLETLAAVSRVELKLKSAQMPQGNEAPVLGFTVKGDFNGIFLFLKMIENSPHLFSFSRVVIQKNSEGDALKNNGGQKTENEGSYKWMMDADLKILSYVNK